MKKYTEAEINKLIEERPVIGMLKNCQELWWENLHAGDVEYTAPADGVDVDAAEERLIRFAPLIAKLFPESADGIIESQLREIPDMKKSLEAGAFAIKGRLFMKMDSDLPISGSVKARGGIYEVLKFAESLAMANGFTPDENYSVLAEEKYRKIFSGYTVEVGSTGNLGLSIGIISSALGFKSAVHMSSDARQWKKDLLRSRGVIVHEYETDYEAAVAEGRAASKSNPNSYFIDDENSPNLFEGYAVAGRRVKAQLDEQGIEVDSDHKLYVIIPCGVGGAPGGVTYGFKEQFGDDVYCFFAEPTHAPCMTLGLASGLHSQIAVGDIGIDGRTEADGLAVGRCSELVSSQMEYMLNGCFTVDDDRLFEALGKLKSSENIFIEPSSCAVFEGLKHIAGGGETFPAPDENSTIIVWATGGNMVPEEEKNTYYKKAEIYGK